MPIRDREGGSEGARALVRVQAGAGGGPGPPAPSPMLNGSAAAPAWIETRPSHAAIWVVLRSFAHLPAPSAYRGAVQACPRSLSTARV